jgi:large subunit ribosomal protein L29
MKAEDLRIKSEKELNTMINDFQKKLWNLRFDSAAGKVKNVKEGKMIKRNIARIRTILKENISK